MEILKYVGLGLLSFIAIAFLLIGGYILGNMICEPIVRKFDMYVGDGLGRTYSDLSEEDKRYISYIDIVFSKMALVTMSIIGVVLMLGLIGYAVSKVFGV